MAHINYQNRTLWVSNDQSGNCSNLELLCILLFAKSCSPTNTKAQNTVKSTYQKKKKKRKKAKVAQAKWSKKLGE